MYPFVVSTGVVMPDITTSSELHVNEPRKRSVWRRWFNTACGLPDDGATAYDPTAESYEERMKVLEENPTWRRFLNANAVIGLSVVAFLCGFFF